MRFATRSTGRSPIHNAASGTRSCAPSVVGNAPEGHQLSASRAASKRRKAAGGSDRRAAKMWRSTSSAAKALGSRVATGAAWVAACRAEPKRICGPVEGWCGQGGGGSARRPLLADHEARTQTRAAATSAWRSCGRHPTDNLPWTTMAEGAPQGEWNSITEATNTSGGAVPHTTFYTCKSLCAEGLRTPLSVQSLEIMSKGHG